LPSATPDLDYDEVSFIPGECLINNSLTCTYCNSWDSHRRFNFHFAINFDVVYDVIKESRYYTETIPVVHRHCPSDAVFQQFGDNAKKVKTEYNRVWSDVNSLATQGINYSISQSSLFYKDGLSLIADKEFAGVPAGENIAVLFRKRRLKTYVTPFDIDQDDMLLLRTSSWMIVYGPSNDVGDYNADEATYPKVEKQAFLDFSISAQDCDFVTEQVNFTIEIPIRSAQYLTWLNDRLTDENAQMTWKDEVLTCTFSSNVGLRKKTE
jgi:hypothetical protein